MLININIIFSPLDITLYTLHSEKSCTSLISKALDVSWLRLVVFKTISASTSPRLKDSKNIFKNNKTVKELFILYNNINSHDINHSTKHLTIV